MRLNAFCPEGCEFEQHDPAGTTCPHGYTLAWLKGYYRAGGRDVFMGLYPELRAEGQLRLPPVAPILKA